MVDKWNSNKIHFDAIFEMEIYKITAGKYQDEIDAFTVIADESILPVGERIRIDMELETRNVVCRLLQLMKNLCFFGLMIHHRRRSIMFTCPGSRLYSPQTTISTKMYYCADQWGSIDIANYELDICATKAIADQ